MILFYLFLAVIAAFAIFIILALVDIVKGIITGRRSHYADNWATVIEAILGFAAAGGGIVLAVFVALLLLYVLFYAIFG